MKHMNVYLITFFIGVFMLGWKSSPVIAAQVLPKSTHLPTQFRLNLAEYFNANELPPIFSALHQISKTYQISDIKPMQGGYSTRVFSILTKSKHKMVLRVLPKRQSSQDFSKEISASMANARKLTAPEIFYFDKEHGVLVMDYLEGNVLRESIYTDTETKVVNLAKLLKRSHSVTGHELESYNIFQRIYDTVDGMSSMLPNRLEKLIEAVKQIEKKPNVHPEAPCHNDLNPNNIMESQGQLWLIDWEMAGQNDPFYDLATVANFLVVDRSLQIELLRAYLDRFPTRKELNRFDQLRLVSLTFYGTILQKIAQEPIFFEFDHLSKELLSLSELFARRQIWTQFTNEKSLSLFALSLLAEAEKIAGELSLL